MNASVLVFMGKDYYATLGIAKDASADAVKKAYRKQVSIRIFSLGKSNFPILTL